MTRKIFYYLMNTLIGHRESVTICIMQISVLDNINQHIREISRPNNDPCETLNFILLQSLKGSQLLRLSLMSKDHDLKFLMHLTRPLSISIPILFPSSILIFKLKPFSIKHVECYDLDIFRQLRVYFLKNLIAEQSFKNLEKPLAVNR